MTVWYQFRALCIALWARKLGTLLTILVIAVSLSIPVVSYLLWKNLQQAGAQFYPESQLTVYLHKNLSEDDANLVVNNIRDQQGVDKLNYISRQQSLADFKNWSGFSEELAILDDNPLPAVVIIHPTKAYQRIDKRTELLQNLNKIKGVQDVRVDDDLQGKIAALSWFIGRVGIFFAVLMTLSVFLVIGNSVRSDVFNRRTEIEVMQLLGATDKFILLPFLFTGLIYAFLGSMLAIVLSVVLLGYFQSAVHYVSDIFAVQFELSLFSFGEIFGLVAAVLVMGYSAALLSATRHLRELAQRV